MKYDTKRRIDEYNRKLPKLREKLMAMIVLLVIGAIMATTVSFAWVTLSVSPEVSGVNTSIASNGNLEIALATGTQQPGATQLGDGDKAMLDRNITWGNLINLSDPAYGLSNLVLRPAYLNPDDLLGSPLQGAKYTEDGRRDGFMSDFAYATWQTTNPNDANAPWAFQVDNENLGVRAISSTIMAESSGRPYEIATRLKKAADASTIAQDEYIAITKNEKYMEALAHVMGKYMTANMNQGQSAEYKNPTVDQKQAQVLAEMFEAFIEVLRLERIAMMELANAQLYIANDNDSGKYTELKKLEDDYAANHLPAKVKLSGLKQNMEDSAKLADNYQKLLVLCEAGDIKWKETDDTPIGQSQMKAIVDALVNVGKCTANGTLVSSIGAEAALSLNGKSVPVIITNGIIYNFEHRTGARMDVGKEYNSGKGLLVTAKGQRYGMSMDGKIYALISTNKPSPSIWSQDVAYAKEQAAGGGAVSLQADDTYGLAIDFWVRTNAAGSFLTLQGNILTKSEEVAVLGKDGDGNDVELWYDTVIAGTDETTGEEIKVEVDIYTKDEGKTWYLEGTNDEHTPESTPVKRVEIIETVIGYEGENRIWADGNMYLSTDTTTQGSGSCYVFYSETPEDEARSLALLDTMKIAFVDDKGSLLAEAYMDTKHYFVDNGKAIVPIVLNPTSSIAIPNVDGSTTYAITALEQNVATRITAIVYLDGTSLGNEDVLAASEIQGKMNVQFGSTVELSPIVDEKLSGQSMKISASIDKTSFDYDNATEDMISNITVDIEGTNPSRVTAFFVRKISATQGTPMNSESEKIIFTNAGDGKWTASYSFVMPGKYVLRGIEVDGVEYDLKEPQTVTVAGFALSGLGWASTNGIGTITGKDFTVMTSAGSTSAKLNLKFLTEDPLKMPNDVEARFVNDENGNSITVDFVMNTNTRVWSGNVAFLTSGDYTLKYLVLDGEYMGVEEEDQLTADVTLGLKAGVYSTSPKNFFYGAGIDGDFENGMEDNEENLYMQVEILDNNGDPITDLRNVRLYYSIAGSTSVENGLDADLTWNRETGYYEGYFHSKVGIYSFSSVTVGENTISTSTIYPTFTIISPEPPEFLGGNTDTFQYKPNPGEDSAYIKVEFKNASTVMDTIEAVLQKFDANGNPVGDKVYVKNEETDKKYVKYAQRILSDDSEIDEYSFLIPLSEDGAQDGIWKLESIKIWGIFANGVFYNDSENAYQVDIAGADRIETTAISKIKATVTVDSSKVTLGANQSITAENGIITFNGAFMDSYTLPAGAIAIKITGTDGKMLPAELSEIKIIYKYDQKTSAAHGGYTTEAPLVANEGNITIGFTSVDGVNFTNTDPITLTYAGEYAFAGVSGKIEVGDSPLPIYPDGSAPKIIVKSVKPTVTITGITPTGSNPTKITYTTKNLGWRGTEPTFTATGNQTSSISEDKYSATLYAVATADNSTQRHGSFTQPKLTLTVAGVDSSSEVSLVLPAGSANAITFSRTGNGTITQTLGKVEQIKSWTSNFIFTHTLNAYYGHGTEVKITEITIKRKDVTTNQVVTYTVTLDNPLTINNPSSANQ